MADPLPASEPRHVEIPTLGISQETVRLGVTAEGAMQVPAGAEPVGWFDRSPTPGEVGPAVLAGHVSWNGAEGVFRRLGQLSAGDRVVVTRADGSSAQFEVTRVEQYAKDEFPTARVYGNTRGPELRLITCSGDYNPATRSYSDNTVVYATMTTP